MNTINDGGPAFPMPETFNANGESIPPLFPGMTLRDYFAAKIMGGAIQGARGLGEFSDKERTALLNATSRIVYEIADAMLRARGAK